MMIMEPQKSSFRMVLGQTGTPQVTEAPTEQAHIEFLLVSDWQLCMAAEFIGQDLELTVKLLQRNRAKQ